MKSCGCCWSACSPRATACSSACRASPKTLLVKSLAEVIGLPFKRIQFTPDLMPADIIGSELLKDMGGRLEFEFQYGPVFTSLLLADEINRTPPKTQSALLEAMQERAVTVAGQSRLLPDPFLVVATQNPIEQEGTYPLPEAQLDRFMFSLNLDYPGKDEEMELVRRTTLGDLPLLGLGRHARRNPRGPNARAGGAGLRSRAGIRGGNGARDPLRDEHLGGDERLPRVGRRPARFAVPRARCQGARTDGRPRRAGGRRRARRGAARFCSIAWSRATAPPAPA